MPDQINELRSIQRQSDRLFQVIVDTGDPGIVQPDGAYCPFEAPVWCLVNLPGIQTLIFLFLQALFASLFGLCIKWVQNREKEDIFTIGAINYIVAAISVAPSFFQNDVDHLSVGAMWAGGAMGLIYFIAFFFVIYCILWVGVSATTVVGVLSILMPIAWAAIYWDVQPNTPQIIGISLALVSLLLIGKKSKGSPAKVLPWFAPLVLLTFFLLCGCSRIAQETFKFVSTQDQKPTFLFVAFAVASVPSVALLLYRKKRIKWSEWLFGTGLGLCNISQSYFILMSLKYFEGFIVFPVTSAGGILITTAIATCFLHERLNKSTYAGIGLATIALFLLHYTK